jgi:hypothetical protein
MNSRTKPLNDSGGGAGIGVGGAGTGAGSVAGISAGSGVGSVAGAGEDLSIEAIVKRKFKVRSVAANLKFCLCCKEISFSFSKHLVKYGTMYFEVQCFKSLNFM